MHVLQFDVEPRPTPRPRLSRNGHAYAEPWYRGYLDNLAELAKAQWTEGILDTELRLVIYATLRRPKKTVRKYPPGDWDNLGKGVCDSLTGIVFDDDTCVVDGRCIKRWSTPGEPGNIRVEVSPA